MSTHPAANLHSTEIAAFIPARTSTSIEMHVAGIGLQLRKPTLKDSAVAAAIMLGYLGVYLAMGFAAVSAASWAWNAVFG
jgi:hypothetical protein